jgi:hypothetical protein
MLSVGTFFQSDLGSDRLNKLQKVNETTTCEGSYSRQEPLEPTTVLRCLIQNSQHLFSPSGNM